DAVGERLGQALEAWRAAAVAGRAPEELRAVTLELADRARRRGNLGEARRLIGELLENAEPDAATLRLHAELAESDGDTAAAVDATYNLMHLEQGDAQIAAAQQLVSANPGRPELVDLLARTYEQTGEKRKLATLLYDAGGHSEDEAQRFEHLRRAGGLSVELGDSAMALMALNEALSLRPQDEATALLVSDAYLLVSALDEAREALTPFVAAHKGMASPALAALHGRLARIAALAGDAKGELGALTRALEADKKNGEIMGTLAERAEAAGDLDLALKALRLIIANNATGPVTVPDAFLRQARI